jgi:hypothetical protein
MRNQPSLNDIFQYGQSHLNLLLIRSRYLNQIQIRLHHFLFALQLATLSTSEIQLSNHEDHQHGAESKVEGIKLDFDGHGNSA